MTDDGLTVSTDGTSSGYSNGVGRYNIEMEWSVVASADTRRRRKAWDRLLQNDTISSLPTNVLVSSVWEHPLPMSLRRDIWMRLLFIALTDDESEIPDVPPRFTEDARRTIFQIELDIPRTPWLSDDEKLLLRRVLRMICCSDNCLINYYCQGMNLIAMVPILIGFSEQETVLIIDRIIGDEGILHNFHLSNFPELIKEVNLLKWILNKYYQGVLSTLDRFNIDLLHIALNPFLCFFSNHMPLYAVLRHWDFALTGLLRCPNYPRTSLLALTIAQIKCVLIPCIDKVHEWQSNATTLHASKSDTNGFIYDGSNGGGGGSLFPSLSLPELSAYNDDIPVSNLAGANHHITLETHFDDACNTIVPEFHRRLARLSVNQTEEILRFAKDLVENKLLTVDLQQIRSSTEVDIYSNRGNDASLQQPSAATSSSASSWIDYFF